jgi:predicted RNA-binding protein
MCLATVYVETDGQREEVMREVAWIECQDSRLQLVTLMHESQLLDARIRSIDLMNSSIIVERATSNRVHNDVQQKGQSDG